MSIKPNSLRPAALVCCLFLSLTLFSQIRIASPYSRFGIGDMSDNNNAWNMTMGQLGIGLRSPYHVNYTNPASYTAFDSLSFLFEGGFNSQFTTLSTLDQSVSRNYTTLGCLLFGIPVTKWWKTSLGIVPFSDVGYNVTTHTTYVTTGNIDRVYAGSGGINRLFWGNGFQLTPDLSVGANVSFLFGNMKREGIVIFPDSLNVLNLRQNYNITINDLYLDFGAQYRIKLKNDLSMVVGAVFAPSFDLKAKTDILATTFLVSSSGTESNRDTIINEEGANGHITIPLMAGGGVSFEKADKWTFGVDYQWQNWKKFVAFQQSDSLVNSWRISVGGEIVPKRDNYNNFLARMHYRLGFTYNKTYLRLRGQDIGEYSFSAGIGIPLRGMKTMLNLGAEYGSRGNATETLIRQSYFKLVVGFSIYERWFVKHKYF